ncbi:unnamed protein product [Thelazia callipaeda]|uniref:Innexin n=1 Tax=Thelazia callipaeda TaxID=103827 RepID=A0A0N5CKA3_THECL|nr:unnamed protein product [Thelazia callipaeda]
MIRNLGKYLHNLKPEYDDDVVDRCNYLLTNIILLLCAITVAAKQYVGEPLQCWMPSEFKDIKDRNQRQIHYYQWTPFILAFQALLFVTPRTIWKIGSRQIGLNMKAIINATILTKKVGKKQFLKKENVHNSDNLMRQARAIYYLMAFNRKKIHCMNLKVHITILYLSCKSLNALNVIGQFYVLNHFFGMHYSLWGFGVLKDLIQGREWSVSGNFPRVTFCDVQVREIGNTNRKTVQCVLIINMFNEKIFIILWFWLILLSILTIINLIYWIVISVTFHNIHIPNEELDNFISQFLGKDALTVLHLVSDNAGELVAAELFVALWSIYQEDKELEENKNEK